MRLASWLLILCTALGVAGVFLPSVALELRGQAISKRTSLSLYRIAVDRAVARRLLGTYQRSAHRKIGKQIVSGVAPRVGGRARSVLEDARDAMDTLDDTSDDDVRVAGGALVIALWTLLGLHAALLLLVFPSLVRDRFTRGRIGVAFAAAVLAAAIAIALHIACRVAIWEANDEAGYAVLALGAGAWLLPVTGLGSVAAALALLRRSAPVAARG